MTLVQHLDRFFYSSSNDNEKEHQSLFETLYKSGQLYNGSPLFHKQVT